MIIVHILFIFIVVHIIFKGIIFTFIFCMYIFAFIFTRIKYLTFKLQTGLISKKYIPM